VTTISVIVPVKNDARRLASCLEHIGANKSAANEVIVVDNGSSDESALVARQWGATVLSRPDGKVAEIRNAAAAVASGELLAFIDADNLVGCSWTEAAIDVLQDPSVGAAGAAYVPPSDGTWVQRLYGVLRGGRTAGRHDTRWLGSGNLVVRRTVFQQVGGFDPTLEACEDVDLCQRLRKRGWRLVADERMTSIHLGDPESLTALFKGERWRGRDNVRVTLRGPVTVADVVSLAFPILILGALVALPILLALSLFDKRALVAAGSACAGIVVLSLVKSGRALVSGSVSGPLDALRVLLVSLVYNVARALALVTRAPHHRR
jgi:hypothetical protein